MTAANSHDTDDARLEALCDAIDSLCAGHPTSLVRSALGAMLAETYAQVPLAHRDAKLRHDLNLIRQYARELEPPP